MKHIFAIRSAPLRLLFLVILSQASPLSSVRTAITASGDVIPDFSPSGTLWDIATTGYVGKTSTGDVIINDGSDLLSEYCYLGYSSGSEGIITVSGEGSTWTNDMSMEIGWYGGGTLNITNGGTVSNRSIYGGDYLAVLNGSTGKVTVDGSGSTWNSNYLIVGNRGNGELKITNGGVVNSYTGQIASEGTGEVTVDDNGSTWNVCTTGLAVPQSDLYLGMRNGACGALIITNGSAVTVYGTTYVAFEKTSSGTINFGTNGGTLTTASLAASSSQLTGTGTIITHGLVCDVDLVLDSSASLKQTFTFSDNSQNVTVKLDMTGGSSTNGALGAGYRTNGSLSIRNGMVVNSQCGYIGFHFCATGIVTVDGKGSTWTTNGNSLDVGLYGNGTLNIFNGGAVLAESVSINSYSLLAMDIGYGSSLKINRTITNEGTVRLNAGALVADHITCTPISAEIWNGNGVYQALGGTWDAESHTFTTSAVTSGSVGSEIKIDLASIQRILVIDGATGKSVGASFAATTESTPIGLTATAISNESLSLLENRLTAGESVLSGWMFSINGYTVSSSQPVYLSLLVGKGYSTDDLNLWHYDRDTWFEYSAPDLTYDGTYASFTITDFSSYAISAIPEPNTLISLAVGLVGIVAFSFRKRNIHPNPEEFYHGIEV